MRTAGEARGVARRGGERRGGERGVGTVLTAALALVLVSMTWGTCMVLGWWLQVSKAQDAADLAALAGASAMTRAEDPCSAAAFAAQHNDGVLSGCVARAEGSSFVVEVRVTAKLHPVIPGGQATVQRTAAAGTGPGMSTQ